MRVLGVVRLSRETDESTSPERQRETVTKWADLHGHTIVGWAEDLDVSGAVSPWERPQLGPWLRERSGEFDALVAWKVDRISRRLLHFASLLDWATENKKTVASATEPIDTSDRFGRLIAQVLAMFAEFERDAIQERVLDGRDKLREAGRWGGGHPPFGYQPVRVDGGWRLEPHPDQAPIVREMVSRVIAGASVLSVCRSLNDRGLLTRNKAEWTASSAFRVLRSRTTLGQAEHKGEVLKDADGLPRRIAEPIVLYDDWRRVQKVLDDRGKAEKVRTHGAALLLGVGFCECGQRLYRQSGVSSGKLYSYYVCSGRKRGKRTEDSPENPGCANKPIAAPILDDAAVGSLLLMTGDLEFQEKRFVPGESHADELGQVEQALKEAREEWDLGLYGGDRQSYLERLTRLSERKAKLEAMPQTEDRWEMVHTGETIREMWDGLASVEERRAFLLSLNDFRVTLHAQPVRTRSLFPGTPSGEATGGRVSVDIPHDLQQQVLERAARTA
ncbi:recombinase family protein [Micromonospora cremea]|uniref:Site-specific DNA recombinase n=1 Tax=Micromonospora cremea TaxID=709881 RepID=A0A1N6AVH6_9ACTN|nr:recombinase family protein [Micromonospora cremea]SIN38101.1 Site-specific DNA recombinase [Micromonospora cremea]